MYRIPENRASIYFAWYVGDLEESTADTLRNQGTKSQSRVLDVLEESEVQQFSVNWSGQSCCLRYWGIRSGQNILRLQVRWLLSYHQIVSEEVLVVVGGRGVCWRIDGIWSAPKMGCNTALAILTPNIHLYKHANLQKYKYTTHRNTNRNTQIHKYTNEHKYTKRWAATRPWPPSWPQLTVNTHFLLLAPLPKLFSIFTWLKTIVCSTQNYFTTWSWQHVSVIRCWVEPSLSLSSFY